MGVLVKPLLTPEQYLAIERPAVDRSEYIDGEMIAMPGASRMHRKITLNLTIEVGNQLRESPYEVGNTDTRVRTIPGRHYAYPDLTIAASPPLYDGATEDTLLNPLAIFEVLSPSTEDHDRGLKFEFYSSVESFREYILVAQDKVSAERWMRRGGADWEKIELTSLGDMLRLESVPVEIPLSTIYDRVDFQSAEPRA